jgi:hypothetical protein
LPSYNGSRILRARERRPGADAGDDANGGGRSNGTKDVRRFADVVALKLSVRMAADDVARKDEGVWR